MKVEEIIEIVERRNIKMRVDGDILCYEAPTGAITPLLLKHLKQSKSELLQYYREPEGAGSQFPSFPIPLAYQETGKLETGVFGEQGFLFVRSKALGGAGIVFAEDALELPLDERGMFQGRVVYRESELRRIVEDRLPASLLEMVHAVKEEIGGEYLGDKKS